MLAPTNAPMGQMGGGGFGMKPPMDWSKMLGQMGTGLMQMPEQQLAQIGPPPQIQMPQQQPQGPGAAMTAEQYQQLMARRPPPMGMQQTQGEARTSVGAALGGY